MSWNLLKVIWQTVGLFWTIWFPQNYILYSSGPKGTSLLVKTFYHFGALKMRLLKYPETLDLEICTNHKDSVLLVTKWDPSRVMRMLVEKYMVSAENLIVTLAVLWNDSFRDIKSTTWGNWLYDNHCSTFINKGHDSLGTNEILHGS